MRQTSLAPATVSNPANKRLDLVVTDVGGQTTTLSFAPTDASLFRGVTSTAPLATASLRLNDGAGNPQAGNYLWATADNCYYAGVGETQVGSE
jgi:hypothetical protein